MFNYSRFSSKSDVWSFGKTRAPLPLNSCPKEEVGALFGNPSRLPGVLMWEVFTEGRMPFEKNTNYEVVTMVTAATDCTSKVGLQICIRGDAEMLAGGITFWVLSSSVSKAFRDLGLVDFNLMCGHYS